MLANVLHKFIYIRTNFGWIGWNKIHTKFALWNSLKLVDAQLKRPKMYEHINLPLFIFKQKHQKSREWLIFSRE